MYKYINMKEIVEDVRQKTELKTENRIREKLIEIFEMLDINRNLLKKRTIETNEDGRDLGEHIFPVESKEFLSWLICSFSDDDVKEMRRGNFHKASIEKMKKILDGFEEMFRKMELPDSVLKQQLARMYTRTKLPFWESKKKIFDILKDMVEDLEVETIVEDMQVETAIDGENLKEAMNKYITRKFRYFRPLDNIDINDELVFMNMIYEDYIKLQQRHRAIYNILSDIRSEEISDVALDRSREMSSEEEEETFWEINYGIAVQNELNNNPRYRELICEREKVLKTNGFVKKLQPKFKKICDELKQIDEETQIRMFGKIVLYDNLEDIDFTNRKTSNQALEEAINYYEEQEESRKEYLERMAKITPEEWEATRIAINTALAERGMPLINDGED